MHHLFQSCSSIPTCQPAGLPMQTTKKYWMRYTHYTVITRYSAYTILWTGDINAATERHKPSTNDTIFQRFCIENHLQVSSHMPSKPTFYHYNGKSTSQIDLFIHRSSDNPIKNICIDTTSAGIKVTPTGCTPKDITLSSQGAPVAIKKISYNMLSSSERNKVVPSITLEIYNNAHKQQGTQIQEHCTDACAYLEEDK